MDDKLLTLFESRMQSKPRKELMLIRPDSESARWVREQWQKRVDGELLSGAMGKMGSAGTSTNTNWEPNGSLIVESLEQTVKSLLSTVKPYAQAMQRLAERLKRDPSIHYISNEHVPGDDDGVECFWWETYDVLLIAAAQLEDVTQQMAQQGIRLIPVDGAWWKNANKTLMDSLCLS